MTAVANATITAAEWNTHVRDNLLETEPAKADATDVYLVSTGANVLAKRASAGDHIEAQQATTSTSYTDLSTAGPAVTVTTGTKAIVWISCAMNQTVTDALMAASFAVSGATAVSASDDWAVMTSGVTRNPNMTGNPRDNHNRRGVARMVTGLNAGSNTFTMKYRVGSGTGHFHNREIDVLPL
ncbi:hypothetical protein [Streptomyces sp. CC53]|uniref:hypothetical protein n=1 Tax=Streptomyces sp. CC53 TaxID=1906740 RepID=UPI001C435463|nr:hypothetical protein [Streptomyces sp. CC53]